MENELRTKILETADFLREAGVSNPETGMVLGTGLNSYADLIEDALIIPYSDIPNLCPEKSTATGEN